MTATQAAAAEPTYDDLSAAVAQLTKRVAHERARAATNGALADRLQIRLAEMHAELRRINEDRQRLAEHAETLEQQIDRMRDDRTTRWPFRRLGNQL